MQEMLLVVKALSFEGAFYVVTKNHRGSAGGGKVNYTSVEGQDSYLGNDELPLRKSVKAGE